MRTNIYILFFVLLNSFVFSQAPGHLGKRFSIGYGFHTSPSVFNANGQNQTIIGRDGNAENGNPAFNAIHELNIEFAASSKWMTCFSVRYYKTVYDNAMDLDNIETNNGYYFTAQRPNGYYNLRGLTYTLYFKYYGKRYVAPWGRYVMFGPTINTVKTTYDPKVMNIEAIKSNGYYNSSVNDTVLAPFGVKEQNYTGINLMLGVGRSRIYANRIILDYGFNIHLFSVLSSLFDLSGNRIDRMGSVTNSENYIQNTVKQRVRGVNRFNLFLKVGFLLF